MTITAARRARASLAVAAVAGLAACGAPPEPAEELAMHRDMQSPIAGTTLLCTRDYPDSRLIFAPDGTLGGRYAGRPVSGEWSAAGTGQIDIVVRAGGMVIRDSLRRGVNGWRGENTACG